MARIKPSILVSDIRGSLQGTTFQQSQGGLVAKSKPTQTKTASDRDWETKIDGLILAIIMEI